MKISLSDACTIAIEQSNMAIITDYDLWLIICRLFVSRQIAGRMINIRNKLPDTQHLSRTIRVLSKEGLLKPDTDFGTRIFRFTNLPDHTPEELACYVDPFCYVSHLSAMEIHGLTDRTPKTLMLTTPSRQIWRINAKEKERRDFGERPQYVVPEGISIFPHYKMPKKIRGRPIDTLQSKFIGDTEILRSPVAAISTIGQTFVDMLATPHLCGGMPHIMDVWDNEIEVHLDAVIARVEADERPIVKVKAGYMIAERYEISNSRVDEWQSFAQRGGSRKLDPMKPYANKWSETWQISLNL